MAWRMSPRMMKVEAEVTRAIQLATNKRRGFIRVLQLRRWQDVKNTAGMGCTPSRHDRFVLPSEGSEVKWFADQAEEKTAWPRFTMGLGDSAGLPSLRWMR